MASLSLRFAPGIVALALTACAAKTRHDEGSGEEPLSRSPSGKASIFVRSSRAGDEGHTRFFLAKDRVHPPGEEIQLSDDLASADREPRNIECTWSPDEGRVLLTYYLSHYAYGVVLCDCSKKPLEFKELLPEPDWNQVHGGGQDSNFKVFLDSAKFEGNDKILVEYHAAGSDGEDSHYRFRYRIGKGGISGPGRVK